MDRAYITGTEINPLVVFLDRPRSQPSGRYQAFYLRGRGADSSVTADAVADCCRETSTEGASVSAWDTRKVEGTATRLMEYRGVLTPKEYIPAAEAAKVLLTPSDSSVIV